MYGKSKKIPINQNFRIVQHLLVAAKKYFSAKGIFVGFKFHLLNAIAVKNLFH